MHGGFIGKIDHHAAAVVAVERLEDHRVTDAPRHLGGFGGGADDVGARHGDTDLVQQAIGQLLVAGDVDRDVRRRAGDGGPDALLARRGRAGRRSAVGPGAARDTTPLRLGRWRRWRAEGESLRQPDDLLFQLANEVEVRLGVLR